MAYAWEDDYNNLDNLMALRSPAGKTVPQVAPTPTPYKKEDVVVISATPLVEHQFPEGEIERKTFDGESMPSTRPGEYLREVHNKKLGRYEDSTEPIIEGRDNALNEAEDLTKRLNKGQALSFQRVNQDLPEYQRPDISYQDLLKDMKKEPQTSGSPDMATLLINSFGPGLLGIATGGYAGADAAAGTQKFANEQQQKALDRAAKENQIRLAIEGKRLSGIGSIARAEGDINKAKFDKGMDVAKFRQEAFNKTMDREVDLYKSGKTSVKEFTDRAAAISKEFADQTNKGITDIKTTEQKDLDAQNQMELEKVKQEGALKRAKESIKARPQKSPTEFNYKSASNYSQAEGAERAYNKLVSDNNNIPPSLNSKFYTKFKSLAENTEGTTLLGNILSKANDAITQRQIQAEMDFIGPVLRQKSGSAVTVGEWLADGNTYFPRENNDDATISAKNASRKRALNGLKNSIGPAPIPENVDPVPVKIKKPVALDPNIKTITDRQTGVTKTYKRVKTGWELQ